MLQKPYRNNYLDPLAVGSGTGRSSVQHQLSSGTDSSRQFKPAVCMVSAFLIIIMPLYVPFYGSKDIDDIHVRTCRVMGAAAGQHMSAATADRCCSAGSILAGAAPFASAGHHTN
jgi:hypothetical protein